MLKKTKQSIKNVKAGRQKILHEDEGVEEEIRVGEVEGWKERKKGRRRKG